MKVCDICGNKKNVEQMVLPLKVNQSIPYRYYGEDKVWYRTINSILNREVDICEECREKVANFIESIVKESY